MNNTPIEMRIIKGKAYNFTVIVKDAGSSTPLVLDPTDTATLYISTNTATPELLITAELYQGDRNNGEFIVSLTELDTASLPFKTGFREDDKFMSSCRGTISLTTAELGEGTIEIPKVTVIDVGL